MVHWTYQADYLYVCATRFEIIHARMIIISFLVAASETSINASDSPVEQEEADPTERDTKL